MIDLVWRWLVVAPADVLAALVAISLYGIPALVGFRAASLAYRYSAGRHAAKLDQTQPIPAIIATIVFFYIVVVMGLAFHELPSAIEWAKQLSFSIPVTLPRAAAQ
jgi:formate hydrogenlyase subunit 3/multisubunit Na+/H+ antiporter MnhD subunit